MKVAFLVQHSVNDNHRTRRLLKICERLGETSFVSYESPCKHSDCEFYKIKSKPRVLIYYYMRRALKKIKPDVVLIHDHICAPMIPFIKRVIKPSVLVYDMSELYLRVSPRASFLGKIVMSFFLGCAKKYVSDADIVITANRDRAIITKGYYGCKEIPLVFENVHKITSEYDQISCEEKFGRYFKDKNMFTVVFAGGISAKRMTGDIVKAVVELGADYQLILLGKKDEAYYRELDDLYGIEEETSNIHYLGTVSQEELKYIYEKSAINVITYEQSNLNNIFCASGRLYESLFCGVPFVSSDNPPLREIASKYRVGVSTEKDFGTAIKHIRENYDEYVNRIKDYIIEINPANGENELYNKLRGKIAEYVEMVD